MLPAPVPIVGRRSSHAAERRGSGKLLHATRQREDDGDDDQALDEFPVLDRRLQNFLEADAGRGRR